jgi:thymidine phosphorylase
VLQDGGPTDTRLLTLELGAEMLIVGGRSKSRAQALALLERALADGSALDVFRRMVRAQGGDARAIDAPARLPRSKVQSKVVAPRAGYVTAIDPYALGVLAIELGAGRTRADQRIDPAAGFELHACVGDELERGAPLVTIHAASRALVRRVDERVRAAFSLGQKKPRRPALILERLQSP